MPDDDTDTTPPVDETTDTDTETTIIPDDQDQANDTETRIETVIEERIVYTPVTIKEQSKAEKRIP